VLTTDESQKISCEYCSNEKQLCLHLPSTLQNRRKWNNFSERIAIRFYANLRRIRYQQWTIPAVLSSDTRAMWLLWRLTNLRHNSIRRSSRHPNVNKLTLLRIHTIRSVNLGSTRTANTQGYFGAGIKTRKGYLFTTFGTFPITVCVQTLECPPHITHQQLAATLRFLISGLL